MKQCLFFFILLSIFVSCKNETKKEIRSLEQKTKNGFTNFESTYWLIGEWDNLKEDTYSKETWTKINDSTLSGFSYTQVTQDTVFAETLLLQQLGDEIVLTVTTFDQDNNDPVTFSLILSEEKKMVFENKAHDFPQRIIYTNPQSDSIHAWIEGRVGEEQKKIDFHFSKHQPL